MLCFLTTYFILMTVPSSPRGSSDQHRSEISNQVTSTNFLPLEAFKIFRSLRAPRRRWAPSSVSGNEGFKSTVHWVCRLWQKVGPAFKPEFPFRDVFFNDILLPNQSSPVAD
ncbi:uncharacterized protein BJ212DRAFT_985740 [Suillus subaureus]|uniref:Secreted protein n=1 Tax=Suillus subaureus TaxID=48587 RepID=A0A9P7JGH4_9AGAM|nr:uncharacterized protein BJ212DRAFT_985740 [Suillus subaureus]KAG1821141.1 hypothetical protein BJ212DRAFT_985740 [Suillus subaureus]